MSLSIQTNLTGASLLGLQNNASVSTSAEKTAQTTTEDTVASTATAVSADGDTLELSAAGTSAEQKIFTASSDGDVVSKDEGYTDSTAEMIASAASGAGISETSSTTTDSTTDLSSYTERELKEMLENGEITKAEYDKEIASRETDNSSDEETQTQNVENIEE